MELQKLNFRHLGILDWLVANPQGSLTDCARALDYSLPWVSTVVNSDLFQAEFVKRRRGMELVQNNRIANRLSAVAEKGLKQMEDTLATGMAPPKAVHDYTSAALKALGYFDGDASPPARSTQVNVQINQSSLQVTPSVLAEARDIMRQSHELRNDQPTQAALPAPAGLPPSKASPEG